MACRLSTVMSSIGNHSYSWPVYVAPIGDDLLLGCDFIHDKDITVNTRRGLEVNGKWIECEISKKPERVARVTLRRSVTIPANSEFVVTGKAMNTKVIGIPFANVEPVVEDSRRIIIAHTLVNPSKTYSSQNDKYFRFTWEAKERISVG